MIEINLTPNRPDCTGVHGIARDLAAADVGTFKDRAPKPIKGEFPCPVVGDARLRRDPSAVPGFALRLVRGVKNGPSPEWLQKRLIAIGLRPINALVDITNFITFDRGRPLHVFDAAKVKGNLVVRRAANGESCSRSTARPTRSTTAMCVIADDNGRRNRSPASWAARQSGCDETTTDVLIESALWDAAQHRADRAQARHQFGRALSLRARRRSGLHAAGAGARDRRWCSSFAAARRPRSSSPARPRRRRTVIDFPTSELKRLAGPRPRRSRRCAACWRSSASSSPARARA